MLPSTLFDHVTCLATKFEDAISNGLGGDTFTKKKRYGRMDGKTDGWTTTDFGKLLINPFSKEKSG